MANQVGTPCGREAAVLSKLLSLDLRSTPPELCAEFRPKGRR